MKSSERTIVFTPKLLHSFTPYNKQVLFNHESHEWTRMGSKLTAHCSPLTAQNACFAICECQFSKVLHSSLIYGMLENQRISYFVEKFL